MKVRMKTMMAGPRGSAWPGDVVEVADEDAARLTKGGYAEAVEPPAGDKPLDQMKKAELLEIAAAMDLPVTEKNRVDDIIAVIKEARGEG